MQLREYLETEGIQVPVFATKIGVSVQAVHRYMAGDRVPHPEVMKRIKEATKDAVQPNDFYVAAA